MLNILRAAVILIAVVTVACSQTPKEDPRVAELQKELAAVKKDLDASKQAPTGSADVQAAAPSQQPPIQQAGEGRAADGNERRRHSRTDESGSRCD